jgi:PAS domain S-box-containing protein
LKDLEKDKEQLVIENERLRRLIKRVSQSAMGMMRGAGDRLDQGIDFLPIQISTLLTEDRPLSNKINEALQKLGEFIDVSRAYIFENFDHEQFCKNTYEWTNQGVNPQQKNLQRVSYEDIPSWKKILKGKGPIVVSNIQEQLPDDCWEILEEQNIQSILAFPLWVNNAFFGFIGFDECSFQREWIPFEVNILDVTSRLISNAFENHFAQEDIEENVSLQRLLLDISQTFITSDSFQTQLEKALEVLGQHFNVDRAYVFENTTDILHCNNPYEWCKQGIESRKSAYNNISYETDLPGWQNMLFANGHVTTQLLKQQNLLQHCLFNRTQKACSQVAFPIRSTNRFWGFIGFDDCSEEKEWSRYHKDALKTIAGILAGVFDRRMAQEENQKSHANLLQAHKQVEEKETFLRHILTAAPVGILLIQNKAIEFVNDMVVKLSGYDREELIGQNVTQFHKGNEQNLKNLEQFYSDINLHGIGHAELELMSKTGQQVFIQMSGTPGPFEENNNSYLLIAQDITQNKRTESELQESQERNKIIIETTNNGILICKNPHDVTYLNKAGVELLGYEKSSIQHLDLTQLFPDEEALQCYLEAFEAIDQTNEFTGDIQVVNKHHKKLFLEVSGTSVMLEGEKSYFFSLHDVTSRMLHEQVIQQSEKKFRTLTENSRDHILRIAADGKISYCNAAFKEEYNHRFEDYENQHLQQIKDLPAEFATILWPAVDNVCQTGQTENQEMIVHYKGRYLVFDWTITPETNDTGEVPSVLAVGRNFTRKKAAEKELLLAKDKAEAADRLKSAFLANMSHEIRTPLNAIVGFSNLLKEENLDNAEKDDYIHIINKSSDNLMMLINDIVDLAKIESEQLLMNRQTVVLHNLINDLHMAFEKRASLKKEGMVRVLKHVPENSQHLKIVTDENRLTQIFNNLLGNALKFTPKGFVEFGYSLEQDTIRFFVRDTGIGIARDKHEMIFDQFSQADEGIAKQYGGTGLGLAICKKLVEVMGGTMGLISETDKGSEFYFVLPLVLPQEKQNRQPEPVVASKPVKKQIQANKEYVWTDKMVLLIDDNSSVHLQLRKYLEKTGVTVISARTGNSARELLRKRNDISMVLMDVQMPDIHGSNFVKDLKEQGVGVPIIAQTSDQESNNADKFLEEGYDEYVFKPINKEELLMKMNRFLQEE